MKSKKAKKKTGWLKRTVLFLFFILLILFIWQHELILYGLRQAKGQLRIIQNAQPLSYYINDPGFPDSLKQKIRLVQEVKTFAVDSLGMKPTDNYSKMYNQEGMPVLWVVTAASPFQMKAKEWKFPLLGSFSYKGHFDLDQAKVEENQLKQQGYDTGIRTVGGWSTLGWFDDPILSSMLYRDEGMLADLIIHELTHTTLYIKDSVQFNENLATFIGHEGARMFLTMKFGTESAELVDYNQTLYDRKIFADHVLAYVDKLDSLYKTYSADLSFDQKTTAKKRLIRRFADEINELPFYRPSDYNDLFKDSLPNNTFFLSYQRYRGNLSKLEHMYSTQFNRNLRLMLDYYKNNYSSL